MTMVSRAKRLSLVPALLVALMPASALAADNWGSIYFSKSDGIAGYSYRQPTQRRAEAVAFGNCDESAYNCEKGISFRNACGAVALGDGGGWGSAWAVRGAEAQRRALGNCRRYTSGCRVLRWQCAN